MRSSVIAGLLVAVLAALPAGAAAKAPGPNGRIVFVDGEGGVSTVNPDGSDLRQIAQGHEQARWSSGGDRIALVDVAPDGRVTTALVAPDGSGFARQAIPDPTLNLVCLAWAPSDRRLACEGWDDRPAGMFTVRAAGWSDLVRLTTNPYGGHDIPGDYSPDGKRIAFLRENAAGDATAPFVVGARGGVPRQVGPWRAGHGPVSWSPDGRWLVRDDAQGHLELIHPSGAGRLRIPLRADGFAFQPGWSPDGRRIVFAMVAEGGVQGIYTVRPNGHAVQPVVTTTTGFLSNPDWGPAWRRLRG